MSTPFSRQIDSSFLYQSKGHKEAFGRLQLMIENNHLGVLTGEVGSGKSTLIRHLFQNLDAKRYFPIYMSMTGLKPKDFYGELLRHVGEEIPFSLAKAKRVWSESLESRQAQGDKPLIVVVDEAQEMSPSMLAELRFVINHQMDSCSLFPFILVGQPEFRRTLRLKKYEAIAQRIPMQYHLTGLSPEETAAYIRHQMQAANLTVPMFAESAISHVHAAAQGIPRIINLICSQALYDAKQRGHDVIEESHVIRVLTDLDRQRGIIA